MSNTAIDWARQQTTGRSSAKCILLVLADTARDAPHVSKASGKTWPAMHTRLSIAALCEVSEQDRKTVMANLQHMEKTGLIERVGTDGQTNQVAVYRLAITGTKNGTGTSTEIGTSTESGTVPLFLDNSPVFPVEQYQFSAPPVPKTGHETLMNPIEPTNPVLVANKELFAEFYSAYPRKVGRPSAEKAFANCKPTRELVAVMLAAIATQAKTLDWSRERLRFVPYPATWLNDERWKDDAGNRLTGISNRHPQWVLDAGFANIDEAHNARCYERFAHDFRDGKRITVAA